MIDIQQFTKTAPTSPISPIKRFFNEISTEWDFEGYCAKRSKQEDFRMELNENEIIDLSSLEVQNSIMQDLMQEEKNNAELAKNTDEYKRNLIEKYTIKILKENTIF